MYIILFVSGRAGSPFLVGFSLAAASGGNSPAWRARKLLTVVASLGADTGSRAGGLQSLQPTGSVAEAPRPSSSGTRAWLPRDSCDLPGPGMEDTSSVLGRHVPYH